MARSHDEIGGAYRSWQAMCARTRDPTNRHYGGRDIKVCDQWRESFDAFLADMKPQPEGCSIDRIDPDGDYEPGNCRWSTKEEQSRNRGLMNYRPRPKGDATEGAHEQLTQACKRFDDCKQRHEAELSAAQSKRDAVIREVYAQGGWSYRSIAEAVHLSHQRILQIIDDAGEVRG